MPDYKALGGAASLFSYGPGAAAAAPGSVSGALPFGSQAAIQGLGHGVQQQLHLQQDQLQQLLRAPPLRLDYDIAAYSSFSASYHPKHIMVNKPHDQSSRWSSGSNNQMQYILLKLDHMAIVQTITFGKYHKVHVCNLKEFKVYGGMTPNNMLELLHSGLRNDSEQETFALKHKANGVIFPCQYIKIVPLLAWGANFNFSIWHVEMRGIAQPEIVERVYWQHANYRETEVIRLCLKHFRQRNFLDSFQRLQECTNLQLEDPLLTDLHRQLVINGDFDGAEELLTRAASRLLFEDYIGGCTYKPNWRRIVPSDPDSPTPGMRGGHQMCIDVDNGVIYLFGGWNGTQDLSDFWAYHQATEHWVNLSMDTRKQSGPGPRSCHKICFDPKRGAIYILGKYVDPESRPNVPLDSDFWRYDISASKWTRISSNTAQEGGPELIYDHQMVVDAKSQVLYVFGGRTIVADVAQTVYSGLYAYDITRNQWTLIRTDTSQPENTIQLKSRIGHSMLLNPLTRELYIFAGQRNKDYLSDFYVYEMDTDTVHEVARDYTKLGGPDAGFTQRATIDTSLGEFYVLSGLMREKNATQETVRNSFWVYSLKKNKWTRVYQNENTGADYWAQMADREPRPRYAHQLVYDHTRRCQYLFGGNPGEIGNPNLRLDDLWELRLVRSVHCRRTVLGRPAQWLQPRLTACDPNRPTTDDVLRRAKFLVRRQRFREMCQSAGQHDDPLRALQYLQTQVAQVVNHDDEAESKAFRELTGYLFRWTMSSKKATVPANPDAGLAGMGGMGAAAPGNAAGAHAFGAGGMATNGSQGVKSKGAQPCIPCGICMRMTDTADGTATDTYLLRTELYESLQEFFPDSMREPKENLVDLVPMG
ncbi:Muskelin N-terminus-domain-containing protein [Entophlyctis helioformis]|nr:Muskelin N-terminus-domain-containing protein [Entophlyctis helioformis]